MTRAVTRRRIRTFPCRCRVFLPCALVIVVTAFASGRSKSAGAERWVEAQDARAWITPDIDVNRGNDVAKRVDAVISTAPRVPEVGVASPKARGTTDEDADDASGTERARGESGADDDELSIPSAWTAGEWSGVDSNACVSPGADDAERASEVVRGTKSAKLDALGRGADGEGGTLVVHGGEINDRVRAAKATNARSVVVSVTSETERQVCEDAGVPSHLPTKRSSENSSGWLTARWVLSRGHVVVLASSEAKFASNPLLSIHDDGADVSGTIRGDGDTRARVVGMSDPEMGWSAYSQSMAIPLVRTTFLVLRPTRATVSLVEWISSASQDEFDGTDDALTDELLMPAHDARQRAGASFRLLNSECFGGRGTVVKVPDGATSWDGTSAHQDAIIKATPEFKTAKAHVRRDEKCGIAKQAERVGPKPRPLRFIADPDGMYPVGCDELSELCQVVKKVAKNREILAAVSNKNIFYMLGLYIDGLKRTNITNYVIVALDKETADWCKERDVPYYHRELKSITGSTDNHATSGLKFRILNEFISTGTSVLLSDVDIVWMQDPFASGTGGTNERMIYRDADVEGMTDGWDDLSSYGWAWNGMRRLVARNSGLFYVSATRETKVMMTRLAERMATEAKTWDQTAYNEEQVYLWGQSNHKVYSGTSQRVMNYVCFQNSKYMFRYMRYDEELYPLHRPASVHINYHPEKPDRMVSVIAQYWKGTAGAIDVWNWGEGRSDLDKCKKRPQDNGIEKSQLAQSILKRMENGIGHWGGVEGLKLRADGTLTTPWGEGKWGVHPSEQSVIYVDFINTPHLLTYVGDNEKQQMKFRSKRCSDGDEVDVRL